MRREFLTYKSLEIKAHTKEVSKTHPLSVPNCRVAWSIIRLLLLYLIVGRRMNQEEMDRKGIWLGMAILLVPIRAPVPSSVSCT